MFGGIVGGFVDAHHNGDIFIFGWRGDDNFLHRAAQVLAGVHCIGKAAGGFHHHLRAHRFPIQLGRIFFGEDADLLAINADGISLSLDLVMQVAEDGIVFKKMGQGLGVGEIVDRHKIELAHAQRGAQDIAPDAAKPVDAYFDCHSTSESKLRL